MGLFPVTGGGGGASGASFGSEYDPRVPPAAPALIEKFTGGVESNTWDWGNQGGATTTLKLDGLLLSVPVSAESNCVARWVVPPAGSWCATCVHHKVGAGTVNTHSRFGMGVLLAGTPAAPTSCVWYHTGTRWFDLWTGMDVWTSAGYTLTTSVGAIEGDGETIMYSGRNYTQVIYDAAADTLKFRISRGGVKFIQHAYTHPGVTSDPVRVGFFARTAGSEGPVEMFVETFIIKSGASGASLDVSDL